MKQIALQTLRWLLYIPARVVDFLIFIAWIVYLPFFSYINKGKLGSTKITPAPKMTLNQLLELGPLDDVRNEVYSNNDDTHNLMTHVGHGYFHPENASRMLEEAVTENGSLYRFVPGGYKEPPSGDMLSAWVYFYQVTGARRPDLLKKVLKHYLARCFALGDKNDKYSGRSSNSGMNFLNGEGWPLGEKLWGMTIPFGISQPTTPGAYMPGAALMSLAARDVHWGWNLAYWTYYILNGGWVYEFFPHQHTKTKDWWYSVHVAQMSLYVISKCRGNRKFGMSWLAEKIAPSGNMQPFIAAMANDCDALSEENRKLALDTLLSLRVVWPQHLPKDNGYLDIDDIKDKMQWSSMALAAVQLSKKKPV